MHEFLKQHLLRPAPYSRYTALELWTDPHLASQMLALHLDPEEILASRRHAEIERTVTWVVERFGIGEGSRILDLGCGPGLYSNRLARTGARVTGVDFSENSLAYAESTSAPSAEFVYGDYLNLDLSQTYDVALLIYDDFCALSPTQRRTLLDSIRGWLTEDGHLAFDVFSLAYFDRLDEIQEYSFVRGAGFWAADDHFHFQRRFKLDGGLFVDRHAISTSSSNREYYNWIQCYEPATLQQELLECGWEVLDTLGSLSGKSYDRRADEFAVVARPS